MFSKLVLAAALSSRDVAACGSNRLWSGLRCYAQQPTKNDSEFITEADPQGSLRRSLAEENSGSVVHFQAGSGLVPRSEVVASVNSAIAGGKSFEVEFTLISSAPQGSNEALILKDLTRNDMQYV